MPTLYIHLFCFYSTIILYTSVISMNPCFLVRKHPTSLGLSDRSGFEFLYKDLNFSPYKVGIVHELIEHTHSNFLDFFQTTF
jgi:hypothetical protein